MRQIQDTDQGKIKVADITLAQLSRGLYKSTASVFKELVSNAYDADASEIRINTNYPEFDFISCVDKGSGMPLANFVRHFSDEGIGSSIKRRSHLVTEKYKRPIIGRLGIGMMSIGQLCHSFEIESHYQDEEGNKKAYKGTIVLTDDEIPILSKLETKASFTGKDIDVGEWKYEQIPYDEEKKGFRIYSSDVRGTFKREMKKSFDSKDSNVLPFSLDKIIEIIKNSSSVRECKPYLETIWELSNLCPLPYYDNNLSPIHFDENDKIEKIDPKVIPFIKERNELLKKFNFNLYFDGIQLKRLTQLPSDSDVQSKLYYFNYSKNIFDAPLKFKGYIFCQISKAVYPQELSGLQVRLRNVGIGGYDGTFLKYYKQVETIRSKWVTGEIFVDEGLESALNIDRDSFNEHEEHYKALQSYMHDRINEVFDDARKSSLETNKQKREQLVDLTYKKLKEIVKRGSKGKYSLSERALPKVEEYVLVNEKTHEIVINTSKKALKKQKGDKIYKLAEVVYTISGIISKSEEERQKTFSNFLKMVLEELI